MARTYSSAGYIARSKSASRYDVPRDDGRPHCSSRDCLLLSSHDERGWRQQETLSTGPRDVGLQCYPDGHEESFDEIILTKQQYTNRTAPSRVQVLLVIEEDTPDSRYYKWQQGRSGSPWHQARSRHQYPLKGQVCPRLNSLLLCILGRIISLPEDQANIPFTDVHFRFLTAYCL